MREEHGREGRGGGCVRKADKASGCSRNKSRQRVKWTVKLRLRRSMRWVPGTSCSIWEFRTREREREKRVGKRDEKGEPALRRFFCSFLPTFVSHGVPSSSVLRARARGTLRDPFNSCHWRIPKTFPEKKERTANLRQFYGRSVRSTETGRRNLYVRTPQKHIGFHLYYAARPKMDENHLGNSLTIYINKNSSP